MVHRLLRHLSRGTIIALALVCAHAPLRAQSLAAVPAAQEVARLPASAGGHLLGNNLRTRFLVGLPKSAKFAVFSLNHPNRVVVEVSETKLRLPEQPNGQAIGLIKSFRAGRSAADRSRIIIYVTEPVIVASAKIEKAEDGHGQQLRVDIVPFGPPAEPIAAPAPRPVHNLTTASLGDMVANAGDVVAGAGSVVAGAGNMVADAGNMVAKALGGSRDSNAMPAPAYSLGASGLQPPLPRPALSPEVLAERAFKPVIVIDPGHGGHDSGAIKNGAVEKDIVLAFSKILAAKLKATGRFKVLMTRDTDVFVPLGERVAFAERNNANLFIAVHCDYADTGPRANGATIYSLRDSTANSLRRSAKGELSSNLLSKDEVEAVKEASGDVNAVKSILADLAGREVDVTHDRTNAFAQTVIKTMGASTNMREEPDQQAGFRVLKTAQFPSVLIELAYVTNKHDAMNLMSDAWRDKVSDSILTAVDNYFSNQLAQLPM
jgi:N-acetylmuramoyl-L-alanine amidase